MQASVNDFMDSYRSWFHAYSPESPLYDFLALHVIIGQLPNMRKLTFNIDMSKQDTRIHGYLQQPSGTQKGAGMNAMYTLSKAVNLNAKIVGELTTNALIGCLVPQYDKIKKKTVFEIDYGFFHPSKKIDIIISGEAGSLFRSHKSKDALNLLDNLQKAMNPYGTSDNIVSKKIGYGQEIAYNTSVSIFMTSYTTSEVVSSIADRGIIPRTMFVDNRFSTVQKKNVVHHSNKYFLKISTPVHLNVIANYLLKCNDYFKDFKAGDLHAKEDVYDAMDEFTNDIFHGILDVKGYSREKLEEFTSRYNLLMQKLAIHHMFLRKSYKLDVHDISYAEALLKPNWSKVIGFVEGFIREPDKVTARRRIWVQRVYEEFVEIAESKEAKWIPRSDLKKALCAKFECSNVTANNWVRYMESEHYLERKQYQILMVRLIKEPKGGGK